MNRTKEDTELLLQQQIAANGNLNLFYDSVDNLIVINEGLKDRIVDRVSIHGVGITRIRRRM